MSTKTPAELLQAWEWAASDESVSAAGNDMYNFITDLSSYTAKVQADALREAFDTERYPGYLARRDAGVRTAAIREVIEYLSDEREFHDLNDARTHFAIPSAAGDEIEEER